MNKIKEFLDAHWEKLIFGLVAVFCLYSLSISLFGFFGASNEEQKISLLNKDISGALEKGKGVEVELYEKAVIDFQKSFENKEGFDAYQKVLPVRLFSEEAKDDPYKDVKDIVHGHSSVNAAPGVNCEKLFCKVKGENICLVCGSKGEREYKCNPPRLTDLSTIRKDTSSALVSNPFLDRQKIRIIWEEDIETDRGIYNKRTAYVYRIEVNEKNEKTLAEIFEKPSYQRELQNFIKENKLSAYKKGSDILELSGDNVGGSQFYKAPLKAIEVKPENKDKASLGSIVDDPAVKVDDKKENVTAVEVKVNRLHDEKVFFNFEDTNFEPLKKYNYILLEIFSGESVTHKKLEERRYSEPVKITTGAENIAYLIRAVPATDESGEKLKDKDGKPVWNAELKIYQYIKAQNLFYQKVFKELKVDDEVGSFLRSKGKEVTEIKTQIINLQTKLPLKGTDLTDADWTKWSQMYPGSLEARKERVEIKLSYFTGSVIKEIGEEEIVIKEKDGPLVPSGKFDEKGNPIMEQKYKERKAVKAFVVLENTLTKVQSKEYSFGPKEIAEDLEKNGVKTSDK